MLYPKNEEKNLSKDLFFNPSSEYRGMPFWAWNGKLEEQILKDQIETMKRMGMGGFFMHVRTGMDSPYLDESFMNFIRISMEKAKKEKMFSWLYDEDRWPSGSAGGKVTKSRPEYAVKHLMLTTDPYKEDEGSETEIPVAGSGCGGIRQNNGILLAVYEVFLNQDGTLNSWRKIDADDPNDNHKGTENILPHKVWYAYLEHGNLDPWFNNSAYVDTMCEEAVQEFIRITYEAYKKSFGKDFGGQIPGVFTDEPHFDEKTTLDFAMQEKDIFLPWTTDFCETFKKEYDRDILSDLPELIWELPEGQISLLRYQYHNHVADRFAHSYCRQIGEWCSKNKISLTGHLLGEGSLKEQTMCVGDAMRCYRYFGIPGMDLLCDRHEYTTAKQVQSIVRQTKSEAMLSELYGVTGWDCDFRTYKLQGDWQAALGVTVRVPHLFWMTMKGEAKRDYPASIGSQSPWYDQYSMIENHFARLNTALTRGTPVVRVAVIHPIESYWLHWGPEEQTAAIREMLETRFQELAEWLLFGEIDFDYISENEFPCFCKEGSNPLRVGAMSYDVVIICGCETIRDTTVERLCAFAKQGGTLLFVGDYPQYINAKPSEKLERFCRCGKQISYSKTILLEELEKWRFLDIRRSDGHREDRILYQLREDQNSLWLFAAMGKKPVCQDVNDAEPIRFILDGEWKPVLYDTLSGDIKELPAKYNNNKTIIERSWHQHDSLLLRLDKGRSKIADKGKDAEIKQKKQVLFGTVDVKLEEPNMLLLDIAEYAVNNGKYRPQEELLRLDNQVRKELGIPLRRKEVVQPYLLKKEIPKNKVSLRFTIHSDIFLERSELGMEEPANAEITFNGEPVEKRKTGWFVDPCIEKITLPPITPGENILEISAPMGERTNLENFYLLGDFGVQLNGTEATLVNPVKKLGFGNIVDQELPFYTGNIIYKFKAVVEKEFVIRVPRYRGGLIKVFVDEKDCGNIVFSPYELKISDVEPGEHDIALRLYGTRQNGFGPIHHTPGVWFYQDPNSYRSEGDLWCYEYQLKEFGILTSPEIIEIP